MSAKLSSVEEACQVYGTVRLAPAWIACTNAVESADHPLLVWFGRWHHAQVVPSFRWPAWNASSVNVPSSWWQALQRASSTIARRPVKPVATFWALGAITMSPPVLLGALALTGPPSGTG